eukprot:3046755-Pyramimonas_sp.AAC.3
MGLGSFQHLLESLQHLAFDCLLTVCDPAVTGQRTGGRRPRPRQEERRTWLVRSQEHGTHESLEFVFEFLTNKSENNTNENPRPGPSETA